jgi:threonylcarbamoyladenosine tRNA methylthiotransferase CDKAL1
MDSLLNRGRAQGKPLVVAGCVPQGDQGLKELDDVSIVGVQQIDRVVEIVEETLKGNRVRLLARGALPALDLPKVGLGLGFGLRFAFGFDLSSTLSSAFG